MATQDLKFTITTNNDELTRKLTELRQAIVDSSQNAQAQKASIVARFENLVVGVSINNLAKDVEQTGDQLQKLLQNYKTYAEKRKEIEGKFNADIAALKEKNTDGKLDGNIAVAENAKDANLSALTLEEAKGEADFTKLFGKLDNMSVNSMKSLRNRIKVWIDDVGKTLLPKDLNTVTEAFNKLDTEIAKNNPFFIMRTAEKDVIKSTAEIKAAKKELSQTKTNRKDSEAELVSAGQELEQAKANAIPAKGDQADSNKSNAQVLEAENKVLAAKQKVNNAIKAQEDAECKLSDARDKRAVAMEKQQTTLNKFVGDGKAIVGASNDVIGILGDLGVDVPDKVAVAVEGVGGMLEGLSSIDLKNPVSIVTGAIKVVGSLVKMIVGFINNDAQIDESIQNLQDNIVVLQGEYELLAKSIEAAYSIKASNLIEDQNRKLAEQKELIEQQIELEKSKKDSDAGRIAEWEKQIEELDVKIADNQVKAIDAIFGADVKSAIDSFASAYVDAWGAGEDRAQAQKDVVKKMIQGIVAEIIKGNIAEKVAELRAALKEAVSDDGVIDEIEQAEIDKLQEEIYAKSEADAKAYEPWLKDDTAVKNEQSKVGMITGAGLTEQTAGEFIGIQRGAFDKLARIDSKMDVGFGRLCEIARSNAQIEANTLATAANTAQTVATLATGFSAMQGELVAIKNNTSKDNGNYGG